MAGHAASGPFEGLLAEAGRLLAASLDLEETLATIARLAVPELADWAAVDLVQRDGRLRQVSSGHEDPAKDALLLEVRRRHRARALMAGTTPAGVLEVLATGEPRILPPPAPADAPLESPAEEALYAAIGAVSLLVVPLRAGSEPVGAMSFLSTQPGRTYTEADFPVAAELADRCGQALRNAQLYDEAQSGRALLDTVVAAAPVGMSVLDIELSPVLVNARMEALDPPADTERLRQVIATGEAVSDVALRAAGRSYSASYAPVEVSGRVLGVITAVVETTERERLLERTERLQAVTERLSAALTEDAVADVILHAGLEATGGRCGVLGLAGAEPDALLVSHRLNIEGGPPGRLPLDLNAPMPEAARTGAPVLLHSRAEWLLRFPGLPPRGEFEAFAAVPLLFESGVAGVMGLGFPDVRSFDAGDVEMLVAIARQGAQALERARLYEERAYVARTLQAGLLPRALPEIEGLDVAVRYRPIGDGSEVGGDFYDVTALDDTGWLVTVGDICGKGTGAAVLTGVMRSTIRALALHEADVGALLEGVNAALLREDSPQALASMACATVRRTGSGFALRLAAGGHPPPLIRRRDGTVEVVDAGGPMLGWQPELELTQVDAHLDGGDLLLLYTDGIIDARRDRGEPFGERRLHEALGAGAGRDAQGTLDLVDGAVRAHAPGPPRDDKALLAIRSR